ncbi:Helix-turn-helix domain-containing protein [Sulfitobacter dubius]|nr:Helix-turn-helix domain-containing protein [Sulfitobacter dubius]
MRIWASSRATFSTSRLMARSVASAIVKAAGLSRSDFFERFRRQAGRAPMEYATKWRMAAAKTLLRQGGLTKAQIVQKVGYGSVSAFGLAFVRHEGLSGGAFANKGGG